MTAFRETRHTMDRLPRGMVRPTRTIPGQFYATITLPSAVPGFRRMTPMGSIHPTIQRAYAWAETEARRARDQV